MDATVSRCIPSDLVTRRVYSSLGRTSQLTRSLRKRCRSSLSCDTARPPGVKHSVVADGSSGNEGDVHRASDEDSDHDDSWHTNYYRQADEYKALVQTVRDLATQEPQRKVHVRCSDPEPLHETIQRGMKLYHAFGHAGAAALDIGTRCKELQLDYIPLMVENEASLDHQRFESYRRNFEDDMEKRLVAGVIFAPLRDLHRE